MCISSVRDYEKPKLGFTPHLNLGGVATMTFAAINCEWGTEPWARRSSLAGVWDTLRRRQGTSTTTQSDIIDFDYVKTQSVHNRAIRKKVDRRQKLQDVKVQDVVADRIFALCREFDLPIKHAKEAVRILLGDAYVLQISLPKAAPAIWSERQGRDRKLNALQFRDKYWGRYLEEGVLSQADLRELDGSLFEAIRAYCKARHIDPKIHLPPPKRGRAKKKHPSSPPTIDRLKAA